MSHRVHVLSRALLLALPISVLGAQSNGNGQGRPLAAPYPRVAVVLSGGSGKGLSQIGALQIIEAAGIPVDLVTGTSMGAIIGGLYAAGYSPTALEQLATKEDWGTLLARPTERRKRTLANKDVDERYTLTLPLTGIRPGLPNGVLSRQGIAEHLERYTWPVTADTDFATLPTPYAALTTDLATGKGVLLRSGSLAQAMEASSAVPGAFAPVRLANGRMAVDGAVVRNIPASDARALGADILICVDVSEHIASLESLHSLIDVVDQTVAFRVQWSNATELPLCTIVIDPDIDGLPSLTLAYAAQWIERGRLAARNHWPELVAVADSVRRLRGAPSPRAPVPPVDSVHVRSIRWTQVSSGTDGIVQGTHGLSDSSWLSLAQIQEAVARLYATGRFDQVSFRLVRAGAGDDLWFDLAESDLDVLGVGIRYDTPRGVALLASVTVADWISAGSAATMSARLGGEQEFDVRDVLGAGPNARFTQTYRATARKTTLSQFRETSADGAPELDVQEVAGALERDLGRGAALGVDLAHEWNRDGAPGAAGQWALRRQSLTALGAEIRIDTYNQSLLPTSGYAAHWRSEFAAHDRNGATFVRHIFDAQGVYSLGERAAFTGRLDAGYASGAALPMDRMFLLGGSVASSVWPTEFIPLLGLASQSRIGSSVQALSGGVRTQVSSNLFLSALANVGNVSDHWRTQLDASNYIAGGGLSVTTLMPVGPISFTIGSRGWHTRPILELSAGASF